MPVILDASPPDRANALPSLAGHVSVNAEEAAAVTGCTVHGVDGAVRAGRTLLALGAERAYVRLADAGTVIVDREAARVIGRPEWTRVRDTTGVGDGFAGGLAGRRVRRRR